MYVECINCVFGAGKSAKKNYAVIVLITATIQDINNYICSHYRNAL